MLRIAEKIYGDSCGKAQCEDPAEKAVFFFEEAEDRPAESVVYFRSDSLSSYIMFAFQFSKSTIVQDSWITTHPYADLKKMIYRYIDFITESVIKKGNGFSS